MNYFIINSNQLQLFDVEEAVESFNLNREDCVIVVRKSKENDSKISIRKREDVTFYFDWDKIEFIDMPRITWRPKLLKFPIYILDILTYSRMVRNIISKYGKPSKIFLGNYKNEGMRDIAARFKDSAEIIFLDEGNTTIQYLKQRNSFISKNSNVFRISNFIKSNLLNLSVDHPNYPITYFTVYDGPDNAYTKVIRHSYEHNKAKLIGSFEKTPKAAFIASILVEFKIVNREDYLKLLNNIKHTYGDFIYFAHPKETESDLREYRDKIGVEIKRLNIPIEMFFLQNTKLYSNLITFQSSAIINISKIFGNKLDYKVLILPDKFILKKRDKENFHELYDNFKMYELLEICEVTI